MKFNRIIASLFVASLSLTGCATTPPPLSPTVASGLASYQLGPGDKLRITVFGEPALTGEYEVTDDGSVAFPLIGNVPAARAPLRALRDVLQARLGAGYVKDPRVSVEVSTYRPYYMLGEINKPGQYPFVVGLRVDQAIAAAGGFTYRADTHKVFLRRADDSGEKTVDMKNQAVTILPGDTLRVRQRYF